MWTNRRVRAVGRGVGLGFQLLQVIRKFDFNDDTRSSVPTLTTWLQSLRLERIREQLENLGVVELADLAVSPCGLGVHREEELASSRRTRSWLG